MTTAKQFFLTFAGLLVAAIGSRAQQSFTPRVGYVFPAGGRQGTSFQVKVGGQYLGSVSNVFFSGTGIEAVITDHIRPLNGQELKDLREKLKSLQDKRAAAQGRRDYTNNPAQPRPSWTAADRMMIAQIREMIAQSQKRSAIPAISEIVTLKLTISSNAEPGNRELRLATPQALSQPLVFCVSQLAEFFKPTPPADEPPVPRQRNDNAPKAVAPVESHILLPCVANGQILPGGVDRYRFQARKGQQLVFSASARELIPYLADAVPGWFQAVLSLYDPQGHEVAYADHFQFHPDPALLFQVPKDGEYVLQIRDSIYRGRDDFVYRITAGQVPFVTGIFPLGGPVGARTSVHPSGWNLPVADVDQDDTQAVPVVYPFYVRTETNVSNPRPFAVDSLPECLSRKPNNSMSTAQPVTLPVIINGRIDQPGQWNVFRFDGVAGQEIVAEVLARRLDSPLDSVLRLTDAAGAQIAFNDDFEDKGAGLQTQYADSYIRVTLPARGAYYLYIGDAQQQGGPEYAYRLRLSPPRPDFALRLVPSSLTVRAGMAVPFTVFALRKDGFTNEITLALKDAPPGFSLAGNPLPANQNQVRLTLTAPTPLAKSFCKLVVQGHALIEGQEVAHLAVPADDKMQAFAYHHLVPSQELDLSCLDRPQFKLPLKILDPTPVKIPAGGTAPVRLRLPPRFADDNFQLELNDPPDGISIANVSRSDAETKIVLRSDAAKIKSGASGNLIVTVIAARQRPAQSGGKPQPNQQRRVALGSLPAIPFQIVAP